LAGDGPKGIAQTAIALGNGSQAYAGTAGLGGAYPGFPNPIANLAVNVAINPNNDTSAAVALGNANVAINLGGVTSTLVEAIGSFNTAVNLFGSTNQAYAANFNDLNNLPAAFANFAFTVFGSGNNVEAGGGPLTIAGSIGQTNTTVTKKGPGFNINGINVGGAAAPAKAAHATTTPTVKTAALAGSKKRATGSAAPKHTSKK
jgi:hypothetical protein